MKWMSAPYSRAARRRTAVATALALVLAAVTGAVGAPVAGAASPRPAKATTSAPGTVTIGGLCLDGRNPGASDGSVVQVDACDGTTAQDWTWHSDGEVTAAGACLDVVGGSNANGALVQLSSCEPGSEQQQFSDLPDGTVYAAKSGKCLAVQGGSITAHAQVGLASCDPTEAVEEWNATTGQPAKYTLSATAPVEFNNLDDTPASTFISQSGQFYYQSSYSLYGPTDGRVWNFYTGSNFDTATADSALDNAVNPDNSKDSNADTTWRCNNSPTGLESTSAPSGSGYAERNYCDLLGTWVDPDTGYWYGLVHDEFTPEPFGDGLHYDSIDYAVSKDQGKVWTIEGHAVTSPFSTTRDDTTAFPGSTYYYGDGDPRLFVDNASGYFYVFYATRVLDKSTDTPVWLQHVARAPMADKMAGGSWEKWYNGAWQSPGVGGKESDILPADGGGQGYIDPGADYSPTTTGTVEDQVAAGTMPDNSQLAVLNVTYDAYLGEYIGTAQNTIAQNTGTNAPLHFYETKDLATEKWTDMGLVTGEQNAAWYRWFLDTGNLTSENVVGKTFRSYCEYNCSTYDGEYVDVTIAPTASSQLPVQPVSSGRSYRIAAADGRFLAQDASRLSAAVGNASSASQEWTFTPTGDGFFTVTNAATGQALGVDSSSNAGRAWDSAVTPGHLGSTPTDGQEWYIQHIVRSPATRGPSVATGGYRLVNRYSGLALSLTSQASQPVATAPQRDWNNSGSKGGDTRSTAAQTLTFTSADRVTLG